MQGRPLRQLHVLAHPFLVSAERRLAFVAFVGHIRCRTALLPRIRSSSHILLQLTQANWLEGCHVTYSTAVEHSQGLVGLLDPASRRSSLGILDDAAGAAAQSCRDPFPPESPCLRSPRLLKTKCATQAISTPQNIRHNSSHPQ